MNQLRDTVALVLGVFAWPFLLYLLPQYWRNERGLHPDTPPPAWPLELATWRAICRVWPTLAVSFVLAIPCLYLAAFSHDGAVPFAIAMIVMAFVLVVVWCMAVPAVVLFNRPHFLVAPHQRALPGWLAERRGAPVPPTPEPAKPPKWHLAPR